MRKVTQVGREGTKDDAGDISVDGGELPIVEEYQGDDHLDVHDEGHHSAVEGEVTVVDADHGDDIFNIYVHQGDDRRGHIS